MQNRILAAALAILLSVAPTLAQQFPNTLPPNTVYGRLGSTAGPGQAIPFAQLPTAGAITSLNGVAITGGTINGAAISSAAIANGTISGAVITGGSASGMAISGGTITNAAIAGGTIVNLTSPVNAGDAATKGYVDSFVNGIIVQPQSTLATAAVLPNTPTYANGTLGVGATLTAGSNSTLTVDGTVGVLNDIVLVKNQASAAQNGIYKLTTVGSGAAAWVLTRVTYFDAAAEMQAHSYTIITAGSANINTAWVMQTAVTTVGTDALTWNLYSTSASGLWIGSGSDIHYSAGNVGINVTSPTSLLDISGTERNRAFGAGVVVSSSTGVKTSTPRDTTGAVYAADYSTDCTGSADQTAHIQAAIDAAAGREVKLPAGTCYIATGPLNITTALKMSGAGSGTGGTVSTRLYNTATSGTASSTIKITTTDGVTLEDFAIQYASTPSAGTAISFGGGGTDDNRASRLNRLRISTAYTGIHVRRASFWTVSNSYIEDPVLAGIFVEGENNGNPSDGSGDGSIVGTGIWALNTTPYALIRIFRADTLMISNNKLLGGQRNISLEVTRADQGTLIVNGNSLEEGTVSAINVTQATSGLLYGHIIITNNEISRLGGNTTSNQIYLAAGNATWLSNVNISNNTIQNVNNAANCAIAVNTGNNVTIAHNNLNNLGVAGGYGICSDTQSQTLNIIDNTLFQYTATQRYSGLQSGTKLIDHINNLTVSQLPSTVANGSQVFTSDGLPGSSACSGSSTGSTAFRQNGAWKCF